MTTQIKAGVIAANAVTATQIAANAVTAAAIASGAASSYSDSDVETYLNTSAIYTDATNDSLLVGVTSLNRLGSGSNQPSISIGNTGTGTANSAEAYLYNAATASGRVTGALIFGTSGASASEKRSAFIVSTLSADSSTNVSGELNFYTNNAGTLAERMTIDSSGNVGIGTTDPSYQLHIVNSSGIAEMEIDGSQAAELNLKDGNSAENTRRGRLALDQSRFRLEGLNDADDTVTHKGFTLALDDGQMYIGDYTNLYGGGAGESGLTINVRNPSDVDRGTVSILDNETAYNSSPQASISFGGKYNTSGDQTFFSRIVGYKANTTSGNATGALSFNLRSGTSSLHTALDLITGDGGAGGVLQFPATNTGSPDLNNRIDGTRINWYSTIGSNAWYATGISPNTLWHIADGVHKWYNGTSGTPTQVLRVTPEGLSIPTAASDGAGTAGNAGLQAGQIYWNTTNENFKFYDGSVWRNFNSPSISSISGLDLWADVTAGISSTSISDLSGNSRTGTASSTSSKGTLNGNTYFNFDDPNYVQYGIGSIPNYVGGDVSYFFVCTNRRSQSAYGAYLTQTASTDGYQILRHAGTSLGYNFYFKDAGNIDCSNPSNTVPVNATINEAYIIIFSFDSSGGVTIYIRENGTEYSDTFTSKFTGTNYSHSWTGNGSYTRVGNSSWATEELDAGMFAWGIIDHPLNGDERQIIYDYYGAKGLAN